MSGNMGGDWGIVNDLVVIRIHHGDLEQAVMTSVRVGMRHDGDSVAIVKGYALEVEATFPKIKGSDFF